MKLELFHYEDSQTLKKVPWKETPPLTLFKTSLGYGLEQAALTGLALSKELKPQSCLPPKFIL